MAEQDYSYFMRFEGGRFDGEEQITSRKPPDRIVVFRTRYAAVGTLVWDGDTDDVPDDGAVYERVTDSRLPDDFTHPNVMPGGRFRAV